MRILISKEETMTLNTYLDNESSPWWGYVVGFPGMVISGVKSMFTKEDKTEAINSANQGTIELSKKESKILKLSRE